MPKQVPSDLSTLFESALVELIEIYALYGMTAAQIREVIVARMDDDFDFYRRDTQPSIQKPRDKRPRDNPDATATAPCVQELSMSDPDRLRLRTDVVERLKEYSGQPTREFCQLGATGAMLWDAIEEIQELRDRVRSAEHNLDNIIRTD